MSINLLQELCQVQQLSITPGSLLKYSSLWQHFGAIRDFTRTQKIEDFNRIQHLFAEVFQTTSRIVLMKNKIGMLAALNESSLFNCQKQTT